MCDYCGCRETEPFAELSREHEELEHLGSHLRGALKENDEASARAYFDRIVTILGPHVRKEERGIFAHVLEEGGMYAEVTEELIGEHVELEADIAHLNDGPADWAKAAVDLLEALDDHIYKEEWDLFPAALGLLSFAEMDAVAQVHAEEGTALQTSEA